MIVELVGPAGAGKSTLTQALCQQGANVRADNLPDIRAAKNLLFFLWNALTLIPTYFALYRHRQDGFLSSEQLMLMLILNGWHRRLGRMSAQQQVVLLDQGPVYLLAELLRFGPPGFRENATIWWDRVCHDWADVLDGIICLDTSDHILMERIRARAKGHGVKDHSDQWALQFLAKYRQAQGDVLQCLAGRGSNLRVISINTSQASLNETVETILAWLNS